MISVFLRQLEYFILRGLVRTEFSVARTTKHDRMHRLQTLPSVITLVFAQIGQVGEAFYFARVGKALRWQNEFLIRPRGNDIEQLASKKYPKLFKKRCGT